MSIAFSASRMQWNRGDLLQRKNKGHWHDLLIHIEIAVIIEIYKNTALKNII